MRQEEKEEEDLRREIEETKAKLGEEEGVTISASRVYVQPDDDDEEAAKSDSLGMGGDELE